VKRVFGQFTADKPAGMLRAVSFPQMALLDSKTGDGREIASEGAGVRELPRTIFAQFAQSFGHDGSVPIGSLQEVTFHETGLVTGRGWLADLAHVRDVFVPLIASKTLFGNSVDLAEVVAKVIWKSDDPADGEDFWTIDKILFVKSNIAATTIVGVPAFQDARVVLEDEVTAALIAGTDELEVPLDMGQLRLRIEGFDDALDELTASEATTETVAWADFHRPESENYTPRTVDADGSVYGHLAAWGECHGGIEDRCVLAPRPASYASFNASHVLTDRGLVQTGPIFLLGGHPDKPLNGDVAKAYGGIENTWADVRVTDGRLGPWMSGRVRPGTSPEAVYAARASRMSGHWKRGELRAIVSCNVDGYKMPGSELSANSDGALIDGGEVLELVASLRGADIPVVDVPEPEFSGELTASEMAGVIAQRKALAAAATAPETTEQVFDDETTADDIEADVLAIELDLDELDEMDDELPMALASD